LLDNRFSGSGVYDCAAQLPDRYQRNGPHLALRRVCQRRYYTAKLDGNLHLRTRESHANTDCNCNTDCSSYCDCNAYGDSHSYGHCDTYCNTYAYCHSHIHTDFNSDPNSYT
jgi:hypothetical protein